MIKSTYFAKDKTFRDEVAANIMTTFMGTSTNLGSFTPEERVSLFDLGAKIAYEAADALLRAR